MTQKRVKVYVTFIIIVIENYIEIVLLLPGFLDNSCFPFL